MTAAPPVVLVERCAIFTLKVYFDIRSMSLISVPLTDSPLRFLVTQTGARMALNLDNNPRFPAGGGGILSDKPMDFKVREKMD